MSVDEKLDEILLALNPKDVPKPIDWKSVFLSWVVTVILIGGLYMFKLKDVATYADVENSFLKSHEYSHNTFSLLHARLSTVESDVKKLKEHRIGQMGEMPKD